MSGLAKSQGMAHPYTVQQIKALRSEIHGRTAPIRGHETTEPGPQSRITMMLKGLPPRATGEIGNSTQELTYQTLKMVSHDDALVQNIYIQNVETPVLCYQEVSLQRSLTHIGRDLDMTRWLVTNGCMKVAHPPLPVGQLKVTLKHNLLQRTGPD